MSYIQHKSEESVEDYLETILILSSRLPQVRSIDIANEMHFYELVVYLEEHRKEYTHFILTGEMED